MHGIVVSSRSLSALMIHILGSEIFAAQEDSPVLPIGDTVSLHMLPRSTLGMFVLAFMPVAQ